MKMFLSAVFLGLALLVPGALAQDSVSAAQMSFSELVAQAGYATQNNEPQRAVPLLKEIISRAGELEAEGAQKSVQTARLQLGAAFLNLQRWDEARQCIQRYLSSEPIKDRAAAYQVLCQIAFAEKNWEELNRSALQMLEDPSLGVKKKRRADRFLLQAAFHLEDYEKAIAMLPEVIARTRDSENLRAYRIMQLRCLFETGQTEALITSLPLLFRGDSRSDRTLNLTLLRIADQLFDRQKYRKALAIYRLVMPKAELLLLQQARVAAATESKAAEQQALETLQNIPDYDIHIAYRAAQIYSEQKRFWEAIVLFEQLYLTYPEREEGLSAFFQKLLLLYAIEMDEEAISSSIDFLERNMTGFYPRMVCTRLVKYYLNQQKQHEALALTRYIDRWSNPVGEDEIAQEAELLYLLSFAQFQLGEYEKAYQAFDRVIQTAPGSLAATESNYWKAMCRLLQQNYERAYEEFMAYRSASPKAGLAPAALFRAGVCRFGLEDYETATLHFKTFIDQYPDDALMPEALSMYGDLLGADGLIDEALIQYNRAFQIVVKNYAQATDPALKSQIPLPASYATFQAAQALTADAEALLSRHETEAAHKKQNQLIQWVKRYMQAFGADADWAQGVFWIGKAQIARGETGKAVAAYLDAVVRYGTDPAQEGVAAILFDLATIIQKQQDEAQREQTLQTIRDARAAAVSPTLQIRLDVLQAELAGTQTELGCTLLEQEIDLTDVPPSGLALMCRAGLNRQDFSRAEKLFDHFAEHYESSPFRIAAYQLRAEDLYRREEGGEALELANEALSFCGATVDTGWAQLMKGKIELARGETAAAIKSLNVIFSVPAWRGAITAEAMFRLAEAWEEQKNYQKAFAFYQRTYLLYKAYQNGFWAAESYLRSAGCLRKMGRVTAARNTYRAMLLDEYVHDLPQAQAAKTALGPEETAELLAGRTNTMETVHTEVTP